MRAFIIYLTLSSSIYYIYLTLSSSIYYIYLTLSSSIYYLMVLNLFSIGTFTVSSTIVMSFFCDLALLYSISLFSAFKSSDNNGCTTFISLSCFELLA